LTKLQLFKKQLLSCKIGFDPFHVAHIVCSIAIRNIKTRWITCEIDGLWGGFID